MQMRYLEENYITITFTAINPPSKQFMSIHAYNIGSVEEKLTTYPQVSSH